MHKQILLASSIAHWWAPVPHMSSRAPCGSRRPGIRLERFRPLRRDDGDPERRGDEHAQHCRSGVSLHRSLARPEQPREPRPQSRHDGLRIVLRDRLRACRSNRAHRPVRAGIPPAPGARRALPWFRPSCPGTGRRRHRGDPRRSVRSFGVPRPPSIDYALSQRRRAAAGWETLAGNHFFVDCGDTVIALCHLQRASIVVRPGQHVVAGDLIACCGNSGNSTEPHLHVQAIDGVTVEEATAVPVSFNGAMPRNGEIIHV